MVFAEKQSPCNKSSLHSVQLDSFLSVLRNHVIIEFYSSDEVESFNVTVIESGRFVFEVELKEVIPLPVRLLFTYRSNHATMNITSAEQYINLRMIKHFVDEEAVPFDTFHVGVALTVNSEDMTVLTGPMLEHTFELSEFSKIKLSCRRTGGEAIISTHCRVGGGV